MRKGILAVATVAAVTLGGIAACSKSNNNSPGGGSSSAGKPSYVGVILPDSKSSVRWETADRPFLEQAFKAANVKYDIQNAQGDKNQFQTIADQMIQEGVNVLMIVDLDSASGTAVLKKAKAAG